jgi:aspartate racemase
MEPIDVSTGVVHECRGAPSHASLLVMQAGQTAPPFFIVYPNIGRELVRHLGADVPVYGLLGLELDGQHTLNRRIEDRAAYYLSVMRSVQPVGPYFLGGRCMGGLVAFEIAHQLLAQGQAVALLALFDTPAPRQYSDDAANAVTENRVGSASTDHRRNTRREILRQAIRRMTTWLRKRAFECYVGLESFLPHTIQAAHVGIVDRQASRHYMPYVYPGRITYFGARDTSERWPGNRRSGWEQLAGGGLEFHQVTGGRDTMMRDPHAKLLGDKLKACLADARSMRSARSTLTVDTSSAS